MMMRFRWRDLAILKKATQYCGLLAYLYQTGRWKNVRIDLLIVLPSRCQVSARWKPRRSSKIWLHTKVNALIRYFLTHCCSYSRMPKSFGSKNLEFEPRNNFFFFCSPMVHSDTQEHKMGTAGANIVGST